MKRAACLFVVLGFFAGSLGCGSSGTGRGRKVAAGVLLGLAAVAGGGAVAAGVASNNKEKELREDLEAGTVDGSEFAARDQSGVRWNRAARASAFVAGLAVVGLVVVWEMGLSAERQYGPAEQPTLGPLLPTGNPPAAAVAIPGFLKSRQARAAGFAHPRPPRPAGP